METPHIDYATESFFDGLRRLGFDGYCTRPEDLKGARDTVFAWALTSDPRDEPTISLWGVQKNPLDRVAVPLSIGLLTGAVTVTGATKTGRDAIFPGGTADYEHYWTGPKAVDRAIAYAQLLDGTNGQVIDALSAATTFSAAELTRIGAVPSNKLVLSRLDASIREAYGTGHLRNAFAMASLLPRFETVTSPSSEAPAPSSSAEPTVQFVLSTSDWAQFEEIFGQQAETIQMRVLEQILADGRIENGPRLAEHEWLRLRDLQENMRRDHYVTLVTPEVTIEDLALNPSVANPRPTQGPPVYRDVRGKDAVLYHGPADIVVYAGDMPTDRATSKLEPNDILRRYIGTYEIGDPRIGPAEHCESLDERFQDAYADVVNHRWIDMPEADLTTAHRDAVASVLGALGYTPEILRLNIDKPVIKLQTANDLFPAYVDLMIQLSRTNPKLAANLFDFATGDSPAARQAEADAGLPPNENLNAFVHPTSNETLRRAFRDPEGPEVEQHFGKLNFHTVILGRALFDQANDALGQQLPQHPQLHQHLDGRVRAPLSLDEARTTLLEFVGQPFPSGMLVEVPTLTERPSHALPTDPAPPPLVQVPRESTRPALSATPEIVNPTPETRPPAAPGHYPFPGG